MQPLALMEACVCSAYYGVPAVCGIQTWAKDIVVNRAGSALPGNESTDNTYYGLHERAGEGDGRRDLELTGWGPEDPG